MIDDDDDIDNLYNELYDPLIKGKKELKIANNKIKMLNEEIKMIRIENDKLSVMTEKQYFECYYLNNVLQGFAGSKNKLTSKIRKQKKISNRYGLGFRKQSQKNFSRKYFENSNCFYCNKKGHYIKHCPFKKGTYVLK